MHALCVAGAVTTQGLVWKFFMHDINKVPRVLTGVYKFKLNLTSKALQVLIFAKWSLQVYLILKMHMAHDP